MIATPLRHALLALALLTSPAASLAAPASGEGAVRTVEIVAHRFEFTPGEITLEVGQRARLRLSSQDVTHGFYMKALGIDATIEPGRVTEVEVTPAAPGRYTVICDHYCGSGHGGMKMTIVVR